MATASLSEGLVTVAAVAEGTAFMTATARDPGGLRAAITIQSMADMGYTVDPRVAEPYRLPMGAAAVIDPVETIEYGDDVWTGPIFVVDGNGRVVRVIPR